jgi:hypothetical protein
MIMFLKNHIHHPSSPLAQLGADWRNAIGSTRFIYGLLWFGVPAKTLT